jgi:hypothetical protein
MSQLGIKIPEIDLILLISIFFTIVVGAFIACFIYSRNLPLQKHDSKKLNSTEEEILATCGVRSPLLCRDMGSTESLFDLFPSGRSDRTDAIDEEFSTEDEQNSSDDDTNTNNLSDKDSVLSTDVNRSNSRNSRSSRKEKRRRQKEELTNLLNIDLPESDAPSNPDEEESESSDSDDENSSGGDQYSWKHNPIYAAPLLDNKNSSADGYEEDDNDTDASSESDNEGGKGLKSQNFSPFARINFPPSASSASQGNNSPRRAGIHRRQSQSSMSSN